MRWFYGKKIFGLIALSVGVGMLLMLLISSWAYLLTAVLIILGFWLLFF